MASLLVVMFHVQAIMAARFGVIAFGGLFAAGSRGVDLFFVLSGFIITAVHRADWGRPERLGNYLYNRIGRIYPAVWVMSSFAAGVYAAGFSGIGHGGKLAPASVLASFLLLPQSGDALVNVTWTLKYEMVFYALFALVILHRWLGIAVLALWQLVILAFVVTGADPPPGLAQFYLRPICLEFGIGACCALACGGRPASRPRTLGWCLLAAGCVIFIGGLGAETGAPIPLAEGAAVAVFGGGAGLAIAGLVLLDRGQARLPPMLTYLGGASYAIYLVHFSVINLVAAAMARQSFLPPGNLLSAAAAMVAIAAGIVFYEAVDRPIQRMLRVAKPVVLRTVTRDGGGGAPVAALPGRDASAQASNTPKAVQSSTPDSPT